MLIQVKVKTGQKHFRIVKGKEWVISVKAKPVHGKANREIINELSKEYGNVRIIKGLKGDKKTIFLGAPKV